MAHDFKPFLIRLDPMLRGAGENPIYVAFLERRRNHSKRLRNLVRGVTPGYVILCIIVALVTILAFFFIGCCAIIIPLALVPVTTIMNQGKRIGGDWMPKRVGKVFGVSGFAETAAVDLYMTPNKGSAFFHAMYCERREGAIAGPIIFSSLVFGITVLVVIANERYALAPTGILGVALIYFCWQVVLSAYVESGRSLLNRELEPRARAWMSESPLSETLANSLGKGCASLLLIGLIIVGVLGFAAVVNIIARAAYGDLGLGQYAVVQHVMEFGGMYLTTLIYLILGAVCQFSRPFAIRNLSRRGGEVLQLSDGAYNVFFMRHVVQDEDGVRWAEWLFQHPSQARWSAKAETPVGPPKDVEPPPPES